MKYLMLAIKNKIAATTIGVPPGSPALSTLAGRTFATIVDPKVTLAAGPYARVSYVDNEATYSFDETDEYGTIKDLGYDNTSLQFSVFATQLTVADSLVDQFISAFQGVGLALQTGQTAYGLKTRRGFLVESKDTDSDNVFHCFCIFTFTYTDDLSV